MYCNRVSFCFLSRLLFCLVIAVPSFAEPISSYNALVFGDFAAADSDVEGTAAIGGAINVSNYSVGFQLDPENVGDVLIVGGAANMTNSRIYYGDFVVGGVSNLTNVGVDGTTRSESPIDFAATQERYVDYSEQLWELPRTGSTITQFSKISLIGNRDINVFRIRADQLSGKTEIDFDVTPGSTSIVNIEGTTPELASIGFTDADRHRTLFNMYEATTVTTRSLGVEGSILAPTAALDHRDAVIDGQVIVASFEGNGQIDFEHFDGSLPFAVPEPSSFWLLVMGSSLLMFRRK